MSTVTIYSTPTCTYCRMAKDFFVQHNVQYIEKNVATDEAARNEMVSLSGQLGVPVINVNGNVLVGFDEEKLAHLLGV